MSYPGIPIQDLVEWAIASHGMYESALISVATVMTDVFHKNEINLLRKFAKFMRIFEKIDGSKN